MDGPGILLSLGLDAGSLDLKADEFMEEDEETEGIPQGHNGSDQYMEQLENNHSAVGGPGALLLLDSGDGTTANERLLEHCESAISGGDSQQQMAENGIRVDGEEEEGEDKVKIGFIDMKRNEMVKFEKLRVEDEMKYEILIIAKHNNQVR